MLLFKQYLIEVKKNIIRSYHGSGSEWDFNFGDIPKNEFQRRYFSSSSKKEARKYGPIIHVYNIDATHYKHVDWNEKLNKEKTIIGAMKKGHKGIIFHNHPDKDVTGKTHDEIISFDHNTINKQGYL